MEITGLNYIGKETSGKGEQSFQALSPHDNSKLEGNFLEATKDEVAAAVAKAAEAYPQYKGISPEERAIFLETIASEILAMGDTLVKRCMSESALPEGRITGERGRTMNQLKLFAKVVREGSWIDARIDHADPDRTPFPKVDIRQMHIPLGPVGIFGASNFPLAFSVAGGDTASALAAGCPVVVKGHPLHPGTSELIAQAILKAADKTGMPDGVFSLVQGTSKEVGMSIVNAPDIKAIGFTGSYAGGKAIFDAANQRSVPIPVFAEMGSTNPVFILPKAMEENKADLSIGLSNSLNLGVGQFCTNPGLIIVKDDSAFKEMSEGLEKAVASSGPGTMLGESIKSNYDKGVARLWDAVGVEMTSKTTAETATNQAASHVFATDAETFVNNEELEDEVFGPSTLIIKTKDKNEMLKIADQLQGHLTATIFAADNELDEYKDLIEVLQNKVGRLIINGYPTGVEVGHAMVHGGPFPATTAPQTSSVGTAAIKRFARPICFQNFPQSNLPDALKDNNPYGIWRMIDGELSK